MSPRRGRTVEEKVTDRFLLLYLLDDAGMGIGDTKLQKLAFLSERDMNLQGRKGFNYNFIKLDYGPYSSHLVQDVKVLMELGFITGFAHKPTRKGRILLGSFCDLIDRNQVFIEKIQSVNRQYVHIPRDRLVEVVHSMRNPERPGLTIHETKLRHYILKRTRMWIDERAFDINENVIASLELSFDPKASKAIKASLQEAKIKPAIKYSGVRNV